MLEKIIKSMTIKIKNIKILFENNQLKEKLVYAKLRGSQKLIIKAMKT